MKLNFYENSYINTIKPYYFMYNGQRYNAAYYNGNILFGIKHDNYPWIEALDNGCKLGWYRKAEKNVLYSFDLETWHEFPDVPATMIILPSGEYPDSYFITLNQGDRIYIKATDSVMSTENQWYYFFNQGDGKFAMGGDLTYMYGANQTISSVGQYDFKYMFNNMNIVSAPLMPHCINNDLSINNNINIYDYCFYGMFEGCKYLVKAPVIPEYAWTSVREPYMRMFYGCESLNEVTYLSSISVGSSTHAANWLDGVSSNGTFYYKYDNIQYQGSVPNTWEKIQIT